VDLAFALGFVAVAAVEIVATHSQPMGTGGVIMSRADDVIASAERRFIEEGGPPECWNRVLLMLILRGYTAALEQRQRVQKEVLQRLSDENENVAGWWRLFNEAFTGLDLGDGNQGKTKPGIGPGEDKEARR